MTYLRAIVEIACLVWVFGAGKMRKNKGFTIIELIVVIAIVVVLTGMVVPQFIKFVGTNKATACTQNRDAILNIFEKGVYASQFELKSIAEEPTIVEDNDLATLISNATVLDDEYSVQARNFLECPSKDGGYYVAYFSEDGHKAYIKCTTHDDICFVDFTGWSGESDEDKADPKINPPAKTQPSGTTQPSGNEEPPEEDPPSDVYTGIWPYLNGDDGSKDKRWAKAKNSAGEVVGPIPGAQVKIKLPENSHFIASKSGDEYVIIKDYPQGSGVYTVYYEWAKGPDEIQRDKWDTIILVSGRIYNDTDNLPPYMISNEGTKSQTQFKVAMGDQIVMHFDDGMVVTYIYGSPNKSGWVNLPKQGDYAYMTNYENWYRVYDLCEDDKIIDLE